MFEHIRSASWTTVLAISAVYFAMNILAAVGVPFLINALAGVGTTGDVVTDIQGTSPTRITALVVSTSLPFGILTLFIVFTIGFRVDGLSWRDYGWRIDQIGPAAAAGVVLWLAMHGALILSGTGGGPGTWTWSERVTEQGELVQLVVGFLEQVFGNALAEESVFRAFLISQLYLLWGGLRTATSWRVLSVSLLASQAYFAFAHIPHRIANGLPVVDLVPNLAWLLATGTLMAVIYLLSRSIFLTVVAHALYNDPILVLAGSETVTRPVLIGTAIVIAGLMRYASTDAPARAPEHTADLNAHRN